MKALAANAVDGGQPSHMTDLDEFRAEVRAFLDENVTAAMRDAPRTIMLLDVDLQQQWHRILAQKGWAVPSWPQEWGGTGWSAEQLAIFNEELIAANAPPLSPNLGMIGPVLVALGNDEQRERFLPPLVNGDVVWCQGYSEPGAGSDLASLSLKAVPEGDEYVLNGQKTWTSYAHRADWMFCLVRTASLDRPQKGITFLLVDMKSPGITVRPIRSIDGLHHLNEVFFNDVRVPVENRIGAEGEGWSVAKYLLEHERTGVAGTAYLRNRLKQVIDLYESFTAGEGERAAITSDQFRSERAAIEIELMSLDALADPSLVSDPQNCRASILKLRGSEMEQQISELGRRCLGADAAIDYSHVLEHPDAPSPGPEGAGDIMLGYLLGRAATIFGGSSEVQKNIIYKQLSRVQP